MNILTKIPDTVQKYIDNDLIRVQSHPTEDLLIYNYTEVCQFKKQWDDFTLQARGLIANSKGDIIARPFPKFFNLSEYNSEAIPGKEQFTPSFTLWEKYDGSLGILYWLHGNPYIATRGSFTSDQSIKANELLKKYSLDGLNTETTYLFEIIYPENRIVVDYGDTEKLVLLGAVDTNTGYEYPIESIDFPDKAAQLRVKTDIESLNKLEEDNKEGFVLRFDSGLRVKYKFEEYVRLHRLVTGVNQRRIWEVIKEGGSVEEYLHNVPEEFEQWCLDTEKELKEKQNGIYTKVLEDYKQIIDYLPKDYTQKQFALLAKKRKYAGLLFVHHKGMDIKPKIWDSLEPPATSPWQNNGISV